MSLADFEAMVRREINTIRFDTSVDYLGLYFHYLITCNSNQTAIRDYLLGRKPNPSIMTDTTYLYSEARMMAVYYDNHISSRNGNAMSPMEFYELLHEVDGRTGSRNIELLCSGTLAI